MWHFGKQYKHLTWLHILQFASSDGIWPLVTQNKQLCLRDTYFNDTIENTYGILKTYKVWAFSENTTQIFIRYVKGYLYLWISWYSIQSIFQRNRQYKDA